MRAIAGMARSYKEPLGHFLHRPRQIFSPPEKSLASFLFSSLRANVASAEQSKTFQRPAT